MSLFPDSRTRTGSVPAELPERCRAGLGTVLSVQRTELSLGRGPERAQVCVFMLPGATVAVRVDPHDRSQIVLSLDEAPPTDRRPSARRPSRSPNVLTDVRAVRRVPDTPHQSQYTEGHSHARRQHQLASLDGRYGRLPRDLRRRLLHRHQAEQRYRQPGDQSGLQQSQQAINQAQKQLGSASSKASSAAGQAGPVATSAQQRLSKASKLTACMSQAGTNVAKVQAGQIRFGS
jgi:hypothetical protein